MKSHMITGLGPVAEDGNRDIFTVRNIPYHVDKVWLDQYPAEPNVGDTITEADDGTLTLGGEPVSEGLVETKHYTDGTSATGVNLPDLSPQQQAEADAAAKKEDGSADLATGSAAHSTGLKKYVANPIEVTAGKIVVVGDVEPDGTRHMMLEDESVKIASAAMLSRITPQVGDYWVIQTQSDGTYEYLNPKDVFERKYSPVTQ